MVLRLFQRFLASEEYELVVVPSAAEAKRAAQQIGERLRLLMTDQNLRDGKGSALADFLCRDRELPVLLVTGDAFFTHAAYEVITKPFNMDALQDRIRKKLQIIPE